MFSLQSEPLQKCVNVQTYGTCHSKVSAERPYECPLLFIRYARACTCRTPICVVLGRLYQLTSSVRPLPKDARFGKAPNQYQKVQIVWYANAINNSLVE